MHTLVAPTVNFVILVSAMVYYLREPVRGFVRQRHLGLREELDRVRTQLRSAQQRYDEFSARLKAIDSETTAFREQMKQDAQAMKLRILTDAQKVSANIVADARAAANGLYADLRAQLSSELADRVLIKAEALLRERLTGDEKARIRQEFSKQVASQ